MNVDIHNYPKMLKGAVGTLMKSKISSRNKEIILEFRDFCSLDGMSLARITRYLGVLRDWALLLEKDFDKVVKIDLMRVVGS